jgi:hypothetical protein
MTSFAAFGCLVAVACGCAPQATVTYLEVDESTAHVVGSTKPFTPPEVNPWTLGYKLYDSVVVGGSYDDFTTLLLETPVSQRYFVRRTDFGGGQFSETYRINGDYLTFSVSGGRFVAVTRVR